MKLVSKCLIQSLENLLFIANIKNKWKIEEEEERKIEKHGHVHASCVEDNDEEINV